MFESKLTKAHAVFLRNQLSQGIEYDEAVVFFEAEFGIERQQADYLISRFLDLIEDCETAKEITAKVAAYEE